MLAKLLANTETRTRGKKQNKDEDTMKIELLHTAPLQEKRRTLRNFDVLFDYPKK
jgi:hypothetical protein